MRHRVTVAAIVLSAIAVILAIGIPAQSEDNYAPRLAGLETRVAVLETAVATSPAVAATTGQTYTLTVMIGVLGTTSNTMVSADGACMGYGAYSDLTDAFVITVRDGTGNVIGTGQVSETSGSRSGASSTVCVLKVVINDLPDTAFYTLEMGKRGSPTYSFEDLASKRWIVNVTVGL